MSAKVSAIMPARHFLQLALLVALLVTVGGLARAMARARADGPTLELVAPSGPQPATQPFDVEVWIRGASDLGAFEFDLESDRSRLRLTGLSLREFLGATEGCDPDVARCALALGPSDEGSATSVGAFSFGTGAGATGDGLLALLHFEPTGTSGTFALHLARALLTDTSANVTTPATRDATVVLVAGTPAPTTTATGSPQPSVSPTSATGVTPTGTLTTLRFYLPVIVSR
ncbi:MAG TPA: hypothetical protein VER55_09770 [Ardenticatenaceae bacterium]|nr:hypothetical protein [Ardenticatenaceae bacterium]